MSNNIVLAFNIIFSWQEYSPRAPLSTSLIQKENPRNCVTLPAPNNYSRVLCSAGKVMATVCRDSDRVMVVDFMPKWDSVKSDWKELILLTTLIWQISTALFHTSHPPYVTCIALHRYISPPLPGTPQTCAPPALPISRTPQFPLTHHSCMTISLTPEARGLTHYHSVLNSAFVIIIWRNPPLFQLYFSLTFPNLRPVESLSSLLMLPYTPPVPSFYLSFFS